MTLGQRISEYRKKLGISQEELGARLGVSRQAVSKWETDIASPDMENLLALSREFGISVAELTATPGETALEPSAPGTLPHGKGLPLEGPLPGPSRLRPHPGGALVERPEPWGARFLRPGGAGKPPKRLCPAL